MSLPVARQSIPETGFMRLPKVLEIFPVSKSTFWDGIRKGQYPKPVKLSKRCSAWRAEDVRKMIEGLQP